MKIDRIDHLVLTARDVEATSVFYTRVLGMEPVTSQGRRSLHFGEQKINLHPASAPIPPHAMHPMPGSADLCFISARPLAEFVEHLRRLDVSILEGPVSRTGATGEIASVYLRDPDDNLIEVSVYRDRA